MSIRFTGLVRIFMATITAGVRVRILLSPVCEAAASFARVSRALGRVRRLGRNADDPGPAVTGATASTGTGEMDPVRNRHGG
jgi:hypothetical protein